MPLLFGDRFPTWNNVRGDFDLAPLVDSLVAQRLLRDIEQGDYQLIQAR